MTCRWVETLKLVACGNSSKQVAALMGITIDAVIKRLDRPKVSLTG